MTATYRPSEPIWCAGCGHYGVQGALVRALDQLGIPAHEVMVLAGIGCSGTVQNNVGAYGYHALHGRVLPTATGFHLANRSMTTVAAGGDGDGYAIGMGHLVHTFRRNPSFTYLVMNNGTYGLTKGQDSPTHGPGSAIDAVTLGLSIPGSGFVARAFTRWVAQMDRLALAALQHAREGRGFAFLEILSPCVTYNDTYAAWEASVHDVEADDDYDPGDRAAAMDKSLRLSMEGRMAVGLLYQDPSAEPMASPTGAAEVDVDLEEHRAAYEEILSGYML